MPSGRSASITAFTTVGGAPINNGAPTAAIFLSGGCILVAAGVSKLTPQAYTYLFGIALFDAIIDDDPAVHEQVQKILGPEHGAEGALSQTARCDGCRTPGRLP
jgi:hypothetical protein